MREVEVVLGLIQQGDTYHLQLRNHKKSSGATNLIGCFGGKIEDDETELEAVCRELTEETSLEPEQSEMEYLGQICVTSDYKAEPTQINGQVFLLQLDDSVEVAALEGELVSLTQQQAAGQLNQMTPGTAACFKQYILEG